MSFSLTLFLLFLIPLPAFAASFPAVTYHDCYDGDTCTFTIPGVHPLFGEKISVRLAGLDTPEIKGSCEQENALAKEARDLVREILGKAHRINLIDAKRGKYFRIVAKVRADGKDIGQTLIARRMAVNYDGGTKIKEWCADPLPDNPSEIRPSPSSTTEGFSCSPRKKCSDMTS